MSWYEIALLVAGCVVVWILPLWQARHHNKLIRENGSQDSLKKFFHHKWSAIRAFIILPTAFLVHIPVADDHAIYLLRVATFTALAFAWFALHFTPYLNEKRGLPEWYVSRDPRAAWTDRTIMAMAGRLKAEPEWLSYTAFNVGVSVAGSLYLLTYILQKP